MFAPRINDAEVPPSGVGQTSAPHTHGLVAGRHGPVPRIEGHWHKEFFGGPLHDRIGKDARTGILASLSSTPFHKVGKDGFARLVGHRDGAVKVTVSTIWSEIGVMNRPEFDWLVWWDSVLPSWGR